ncbi:hypothetical protein BH23PLA1_BH23PLA1_27300 [soil metagenome]
MATKTTNKAWIAAQFSKGIEAEQTLADKASQRAEAPPDPSLAVLYHEIASADERHAKLLETIAIRYGHTPNREGSGGIGQAFDRFKGKVASSVAGSTPLEKLSHDLAGKASSIHWYHAWIHAFQSIGDVESTRELSGILTEESAHRDALQEGLNRMVEHGAQTGKATTT